jgi:hypothetical protein
MSFVGITPSSPALFPSPNGQPRSGFDVPEAIVHLPDGSVREFVVTDDLTCYDVAYECNKKGSFGRARVGGKLFRKFGNKHIEMISAQKIVPGEYELCLYPKTWLDIALEYLCAGPGIRKEAAAIDNAAEPLDLLKMKPSSPKLPSH